jgi:large subunit ribosomal protein L24
MLRIRRDDIVYVISGKDKGKSGKVIKVFRQVDRAIVEKINLVKKHMRKTKQDGKSGIVSVERPIHLSKLMIFCKSCNKPVRVGIKFLKDDKKARFCKRCKETI